MRFAALLLVATACGRIGFEGRAGGDGGTGDGPVVLDDGFIAPACGVGAETVVSGATANAGFAEIVWTGDMLGIAWGEITGEYDIMFARADASGVPLGTTNNISNAVEHSWFPALAWNGTELAVTWSDDRDGDNDARFARISPATGTRIGSDLAVSTGTGDSWFPTLAWVEPRWEVVWADDEQDNYEVWRAAVSGTGTLANGPARATTSASPSWAPVIAWTGQYVVTAWGEEAPDEQMYVRFVEEATGNDSGPIVVTASSGLAAVPSIVWTGSELAVAWADTRGGTAQIYVARYDTTGARIGVENLISRGAGTASEPDLVWNGMNFGVAWHDNRSGVDQVYFALLDASGARVAGEVPVTSGPTSSDSPALEWTGSQFVVAYHGIRGGRTDNDIFTATVCAP